MSPVEGKPKDGKTKTAKKQEPINQSPVPPGSPLDHAAAGELRARLKTVADDWERPEADSSDED